MKNKTHNPDERIPVPRRSFIDRSARYEFCMKVHAMTFGNPIPYDLETVNISFSGVLIASKELMPFQINTLLEIDFISERLPVKVNSICKVKRISNDMNVPQYKYFYGIKIVEISTNNLNIWKDFLKTFASFNGDDEHKEEDNFLESNPEE